MKSQAKVRRAQDAIVIAMQPALFYLRASCEYQPLRAFVTLETTYRTGAQKEMRFVDQQMKKTARVWRPLMAALALGCALGAVNHVSAQTITSPTTPTTITPPVGNSAFLLGQGVGTQGYVCLPKGTGASWTVNNARPEATLFSNFLGAEVQIINHFLSPVTNPNQFAPNPLPFGSATWQSAFDSSMVWASAQQAILAGSDSSCPNTGAIACLLLQVIGSQTGPTGGKAMTKTTFIQRLNTKGGSAPGTGCSVSTDVGKQALVPYAADYYFFRPDRTEE